MNCSNQQQLDHLSFLIINIIKKQMELQWAHLQVPHWPTPSSFRKVTFSGVFTNYDSFISDTYKIGLVHVLLFQFLKMCSSMENVHIEVELLRSIFKCNNYHVNIIDQCIKKFFGKLYVPEQIVSTVTAPKRNCQLFFHIQEHFL